MFGKLRELLGAAQKQPMSKPARPMMEMKKPLPYLGADGKPTQFFNNPTFAGNLNPSTEDGYDTTIKYLRGSMPQQQVADYIPGNFAGRPLHAGAMQGSNPFRNIPQRNIYQNISPFDQDTILRGSQIQSPDLDRYY